MENNIEKYIDLFKAYYKKNALQLCFDEGPDCSEKIIRSHSIQNSFVLDQIQDANHVDVIDYTSNGNICFKSIGRNNASTFTGFCNHHDTKIFSAIDFTDSDSIEALNQQQLVLFHYRTLCREYWSKLNAVKVFDFIKAAISSKNTNDLLKVYPFLNGQDIDWNFLDSELLEFALLGQTMGSKDVEEFYESLRYQIKENKYHLTKGIHFKIDVPAKFALSSFISPVCDFKGNPTNDFTAKTVHYIGLNVFPHKDETNVVLTWHKKSNYENLGKQLLELSSEEQKVQLSKFILAHSENIVFSPELTKRLESEQMERINKIFIQTATSEWFKLDDYEDVNLF